MGSSVMPIADGCRSRRPPPDIGVLWLAASCQSGAEDCAACSMRQTKISVVRPAIRHLFLGEHGGLAVYTAGLRSSNGSLSLTRSPSRHCSVQSASGAVVILIPGVPRAFGQRPTNCRFRKPVAVLSVRSIRLQRYDGFRYPACGSSRTISGA